MEWRKNVLEVLEEIGRGVRRVERAEGVEGGWKEEAERRGE